MHTPLLFELSDYDKRQTASEAEFKEKNMNLLTAIPAMVERSFQRLNKEVFSSIELRSRNKNLAATTINGYLCGELTSTFPEYCKVATKLRFCMKTENGEWIYIKKLYKDKEGRRLPQLYHLENTF